MCIHWGLWICNIKRNGSVMSGFLSQNTDTDWKQQQRSRKHHIQIYGWAAVIKSTQKKLNYKNIFTSCSCFCEPDYCGNNMMRYAFSHCSLLHQPRQESHHFFTIVLPYVATDARTVIQTVKKTVRLKAVPFETLMNALRCVLCKQINQPSVYAVCVKGFQWIRGFRT